MKLFVKIVTAVLFSAICLTACIKDNVPVVSATMHYNNLKDFYAQAEMQAKVYAVNATTGGSFTTAQGTVVNVPANAFINATNTLVTGTVFIEFKDIYKKSDMLLNNIIPTSTFEQAMNSGGEFYIWAESAGLPVQLCGTKPITITQPLNGWPMDANMKPLAAFTGGFGDTLATIQTNANAWVNYWVPPTDSNGMALVTSTAGYVFSLFQFSTPLNLGSWCNSDNSNYFSTYTQVPFVIATTDSVSTYSSDVFLLFTGLNSMVHVYQSTISTYNYPYAPQSLKCTIVALEVNGKGQLLSAFVPATIGANDTVKFNASPTTMANFEIQLATYNH